MPLCDTGAGRAAPSEICRTPGALSIKRAVLPRWYYGGQGVVPPGALRHRSVD